MHTFRTPARDLALAYSASGRSLNSPSVKVLSKWNTLQRYIAGDCDIGSGKWVSLIEWFAANWPEDLPWPANVPHPDNDAIWKPRDVLAAVAPVYCAARGQALATVSGIALSMAPRLNNFLSGTTDMRTDSVELMLAFCSKYWPEDGPPWPAGINRPMDFTNVPANERRPRPGSTRAAA